MQLSALPNPPQVSTLLEVSLSSERLPGGLQPVHSEANLTLSLVVHSEQNRSAMTYANTTAFKSVQGGKLTRPSQEDLVHRVTVGGQQLLHYSAPVIDVAVLRGTTADVAGNIGFEREAVLGDSLNQVLRHSASGFRRCTALRQVH